jgi:hypothetical protein
MNVCRHPYAANFLQAAGTVENQSLATRMLKSGSDPKDTFS